MSGEINLKSFGQAKMVAPKYLSDSLTPWYGTWSVCAGGALALDYTNLPTGDCQAKLVFTTNVANRFLHSGLSFYPPGQCLVGTKLSFKYKFSRSEAVNHNIWLTTTGGPYAEPTLEAPGGLLNPTPTTWTDFSMEISRFINTASAPRLRLNSMATRVLFFFFYGFPFSGPTTFEIANFTFQRL